MKKGDLTMRQAVSTMVMYLLGNSLVLGGTTGAAQDSWISLLIAQGIALPLLLLEARLIRLYPGKNLFGMLEAALGRVAGKIAAALMVWYAIHLSAIVLRTYSEFVEIVAMPETPELPLMILMILTCVYLAKCGVKVLGKWSQVTLYIVSAIVMLTIVMLLNQLDLSNLLPVMSRGMAGVLPGAYGLFSFPFGESVLLLSIADFIPARENPFRLVLTGSLVTSLILLLVLLRNITALGPALLEAEYFPSYTAARIISVSDFLVRIEGSISTNFILSGITKITVCLLAAARGLASLFGVEDYRKLVLPATLSALALACILVESVMELINFDVVCYPVYAAPFEVVVPVLAWIAAELRGRARKKPKARPEQVSRESGGG